MKNTKDASSDSVDRTLCVGGIGMANNDPGQLRINPAHAKILQQPLASIANRLIAQVAGADPPFATLRILSAYTTLNGVDVFEKMLRTGFAKNNAIDVFLSVGIDQKRTTYDALNRLLQLKGEFGNLHVSIIHDERVNHRFHAKVYNFESNTNAFVFVGSSNLTRSGLTSNYEIVTVLHFDMNSSNGYSDLVASLKPYFTPAPTGWVRELSWELLSALEKKDWFDKRDEDESERE
jgi:HKD family nuclease